MTDEPTLESVQQLTRSFLARENLSTVRNYASALEDYRRYAKARTAEGAVRELIALGPAKANERVARYQAAMLGKRDERGRVLSGRGLSPAAANLRLTVLRSLFKKARRHGIVQWELDVGSVAQELVHDVRGPRRRTFK